MPEPTHNAAQPEAPDDNESDSHAPDSNARLEDGGFVGKFQRPDAGRQADLPSHEPFDDDSFDEAAEVAPFEPTQNVGVVDEADGSDALNDAPAHPAANQLASSTSRAWPWDDDPLDPLPPDWPLAAEEMPTADFPAIPEAVDPEEETRTVVLIPGRGWVAQPTPPSQSPNRPPSAPRPTTETATAARTSPSARSTPNPAGVDAPGSLTSSPSAPTGNVSRPAKRRRGRGLFWPAFVASLLLCSTVACGGLALLVGLGDVTLADLQGNPVWTPPPSTATPIAPPVEAGSSPDLTGSVADTFQAGDMPRNLTNTRVNIRREPGFRNKPDGDIVAQAAPDDTFEIVGPSARADNLIWWLVRHTASNTEGWVAEATESGVQILGE